MLDVENWSHVLVCLQKTLFGVSELVNIVSEFIKEDYNEFLYNIINQIEKKLQIVKLLYFTCTVLSGPFMNDNK